MRKLLSLFILLPLLLTAEVSWVLPAQILNSTGGNGLLPTIAIDPQGNAVAAWVNTGIGGAGISRVQVSYRNPSGNWSLPVVPTEGTLDPANVTSSPGVAIDKNGNAVVAWFSYVNGFFTVQAALKAAKSTSWSLISQVSTPSTNVGSNVAVAWDDLGNAIIGWSLSGGAIQSRTVDLKGVMTPVVTVSSASSVTSNLVMTTNKTGDVFAVWINNIPGKTVQGSIKNSGEGWGTVSDISPTDDLAQSPAPAIDDSKNTMVIWNISTAAAQTKVYTSEKLATSSSWDSHRLVSSTAYNPPNQQIAVDSKGNMTAAWIDNSPTTQKNPHVDVATKMLGETLWSLPAIISNPDHEAEGSLSLGVNAINEKVLLWSYDSTTNYPGAIVSRFLSADSSSWGSEIILSDGIGTSPGACSLVVNPNGQIAGTWSIEEPSSLIKAVSGVFSVASPTSLTVSQKNNDFALLSEYYNILKWEPSVSPGVIGYNIYLFDSLITTVGANVTQYEAHNQKQGQPATYTVTAVGSDGQESAGATISLE